MAAKKKTAKKRADTRNARSGDEPSSERVSSRTRCTPEQTEQVCKYVAGGASIPDACEMAGLSWNVAKEWRVKGRAGKEPFAHFYEQTEKAKATWRAVAAMRVSAAGKKDWRASAWLLERRSAQYRPPQRVEHTGKDGGPMQYQELAAKAASMSMAELEREAEAALLPQKTEKVGE